LRLVNVLAYVILIVSHAGPTLAENGERRIELGGNVIFRLGYNGVYDADASLPETNDILGLMIASPEISFGPQVTLKSEFRLEDIRPPFEDRAFEDEGLFARKLFAEVTVNDQISIQAGKFTPTFSFASLVTPGMYGNNYNKEIELIERVGFGADYRFINSNGASYKFSAATFFDDTSFLSDSLGSSRGQKSLSDGGASNTESFESFALSLEGSNFREVPGLTYRIGLLHEARGEGDTSNENGFLIAAARSLPLSRGRKFTWIAEVAPIWNFEGSADDIVYASGGLVYEEGPWTGVLSGTYRVRELGDGNRFDDYSIQTSIDYALGGGFSLAIAHEFLRAQNNRSRRIGVRFSKVIDLGRQ